ncbi:ABC transporter ATP-binding protein/permease [Mycobacteroides abscessus]|uniref:ABC transporter ATP-binding protein/permease n=1 Tax=Mycobacteroides abscessus TaxID=36809 RepID=UPI0012FFE311|nr:ATP-binding cassette domain-containing protein [Mycobacteroides abscessus]
MDADVNVLTAVADPADYRLSRKFFGRMWRLVRPYWVNRDSRRSWILLIAVLLLIVAGAWMHLLSAEFTRDVTNALVAKDQSGYTRLFWLATLLIFAQGSSSILGSYLGNRIAVHWREWLTKYVVDHYLNHRTYYDIALRGRLDNPDQRMQEQVTPFITAMIALPTQLLSQVLQLFTGAFIVASVSASLVWGVFAYSIIQTAATLWIYTPTIRLNYELTIAEANLRSGLLHVRENAETIAFYNGEGSERRQVVGRLRAAVKRQWFALRYQAITSGGTQILSILWRLGPFFLIAPLFFQGKITYGAIAMATASATAMMMALTSLSRFIPSLTEMAPGAVRLAQILERHDNVAVDKCERVQSKIQLSSGELTHFSAVTLQTPNGEQELVKDVSFELSPGERLIIAGPTGTGKSSLLRAMAGLWHCGTGTITMPPADRTIFVPQRPYMTLADLRSQLLYPSTREDVTDDELQNVLERVQLPDLLDKYGGLDSVQDWGNTLSLGEQQRIGFARVLLSRAAVALLDEATSAVDLETETKLYDLLNEMGITYISIGHRESLHNFHDTALRLDSHGAAQITKLRIGSP